VALFRQGLFAGDWMTTICKDSPSIMVLSYLGSNSGKHAANAIVGEPLGDHEPSVTEFQKDRGALHLEDSSNVRRLVPAETDEIIWPQPFSE
jgi:hypothetical protein